jgi:hypothetical protein
MRLSGTLGPNGKEGERGEEAMRTLIQSNDPVRLSFLEALLAQAGIEAVILDLHMSVLEGSIGAIPRRLAVAEEDYDRALRLLAEAGEA